MGLKALRAPSPRIRHRAYGPARDRNDSSLSFESSKATASSSAHPPNDPIFHAVEPGAPNAHACALGWESGADPRPPGKPPLRTCRKRARRRLGTHDVGGNRVRANLDLRAGDRHVRTPHLCRCNLRIHAVGVAAISVERAGPGWRRSTTCNRSLERGAGEERAALVADCRDSQSDRSFVFLSGGARGASSYAFPLIGVAPAREIPPRGKTPVDPNHSHEH